MSWTPADAAERAEAERLYAAINSRPWSSLEELQAQPRRPGRWLLRLVIGPHLYTYWAGDDADGDALWTPDPAAARKMTHDRAIRRAVKRTREVDQEESEHLYYLPVPLEEAIGDAARAAGPAGGGEGEERYEQDDGGG